MPDNSNYQFRAVPLDLLSYVTNKPKSAKYYFRYLLNRTMMMFEYKNLPSTIDPHVLERYLQVNGVACITKAPDGNLYCFNGSWGGSQDVYYRPTKFIIANPHLSQLKDGSGKQFTKECTIFGSTDHDGVLLRNDTEWASLTPLIARYAVLMCENCITVRTATIMLRCLALLSADNDKTKKSAESYLKKLTDGDLGVIMDSAFSEGVRLQSPPSNNGSYLTQFIELQQYLKGSFFNELGLRANYNMKREAIGQGESTLDADSILPLCDNMLKCRREDINEVNNLFNCNISVDFSSAWLENHLESSINIISQLNEAGVVEGVAGGLVQVGSTALNSEDSNIPETATSAQMKEGGSNAERENTDKSSESSNGSSGNGDSGAGADDRGLENGNQSSESENGSNGNDQTAAENGTSGEGGEDSEGREDERREDERREDERREEVQEVKDELKNEDLTFVEGAVEVVNNKISQLIAEAREGDLEDE